MATAGSDGGYLKGAPDGPPLSWSGGKDSCVALHQLQSSGDYDVTALLTTITPDDDRIAVHRVRGELLVRQAASLGLSLDEFDTFVVPGLNFAEIIRFRLGDRVMRRGFGYRDLIPEVD